MAILKGVREEKNPLWASDFREGFWKMMET